MYDQTIYTLLITYQVGTGYAAEPMQQLIVDVAQYDEAAARQEGAKILALNPAIERYIINVMPGGTTIK